MEGALEKLKGELSGKVVAVAVSGGRDSMALLDLFRKSKLNFFAFNVEHGIRGEESKSDSRFVEDYCKKRGIRFKGVSVDAISYSKKMRLTLETAARELRYSEFSNLLSAGECDFVALAHHEDDDAETILMRLCRGTGLKGLCGMEFSKRGYLRPLLGFSRQDIDDYIEKNSVPFVDDSSNLITDANRNFLRLEVVPLIEQRYPSFKRSLIRLKKNAAETEDFVSKFVREPERVYKYALKIALPFPHDAVLKREVLLAAQNLGVFQDIEETHLNTICALKENDTAKRINLKHGLTAYKEPDGILIALEDNFDKSERGFEMSEQTINGGFYRYFVKSVSVEPSNNEFLKLQKLYKNHFDEDFNIECQGGEKPFDLVSDSTNCGCLLKFETSTLCFDGDKIPKNALIRYKKEGDTFTKFGGGTKSLGDYFTDKKITLYERERIPVLAVGSDILMIFGVEISDKIKITENTKRIFKVTKEKI